MRKVWVFNRVRGLFSELHTQNQIHILLDANFNVQYTIKFRNSMQFSKRINFLNAHEHTANIVLIMFLLSSLSQLHFALSQIQDILYTFLHSSMGNFVKIYHVIKYHKMKVAIEKNNYYYIKKFSAIKKDGVFLKDLFN